MTPSTDLPVVTVPAPHFEWGQPTTKQRNALKTYIDQGGSMSIYGDDGIYQSLETWLADYYKTRYVILTNTGTSALNSAYVGLGIQEGDEVIVPTYTFLATVTPLLRLRAIPIFADADPETGNIDPTDIEHRITSKTKAIAVTHMWGVACDMKAIMEIARKHSLKVVEDCSHAHFTQYKGKLLGTYGDVACLSIGAKKTLTSGEGGFMFTNDPEIYLRASLLGHFEVRAKSAIERIQAEGHDELYNRYKDLETGFGENYRMHPYSAVMAESLLLSGEIFELIEKRRESLKYFTECLAKEVTIIQAPVFDEDFYTGAMYGYKAKVRTDLLTCTLEEAVAVLRAQNINIKMPDSTPLHEKPLFHKLETLDLGYHEALPIAGDFAGSQHYMDGRVSLPTFTRGLAEDREVIDQYIKVFKAFEKQYLKK
jgi:perosamine synthetase